MTANVYAQRSYLKHRDERLRKAKAYQKKHPEVARKATSKYYQKNRDELLAKNKKWLLENKERRQEYVKKFGRRNMLKSKYGLSLDQFMSLLSFQNNCCAICKTEFKGTKDTHVDHCHKTKR